MEEESKKKTAFISSKGLYQLKKMPYGLWNAATTFQQLMEQVLSGLRGMICFVYIDDIIIYSQTYNQHTRDISAVLQKFTQANFTFNMKKCHFIKL